MNSHITALKNSRQRLAQSPPLIPKFAISETIPSLNFRRDVHKRPNGRASWHEDCWGCCGSPWPEILLTDISFPDSVWLFKERSNDCNTNY